LNRSSTLLTTTIGVVGTPLMMYTNPIMTIHVSKMGLIRNLKIYVHNIPYIIMFVVLQNSVIDYNYSMLLGRPWLRDAKVAHDWGE
jgi:hypothetical protein